MNAVGRSAPEVIPTSSETASKATNETNDLNDEETEKDVKKTLSSTKVATTLFDSKHADAAKSEENEKIIEAPVAAGTVLNDDQLQMRAEPAEISAQMEIVGTTEEEIKPVNSAPIAASKTEETHQKKNEANVKILTGSVELAQRAVKEAGVITPIPTVDSAEAGTVQNHSEPVAETGAASADEARAKAEESSATTVVKTDGTEMDIPDITRNVDEAHETPANLDHENDNIPDPSIAAAIAEEKKIEEQKKNREEEIEFQNSLILLQHKFISSVETLEDKIFDMISAIEKGSGITFTDVFNESGLIMCVDIISVTGVRETDPDTVLTMNYCGYSVMETRCVYESHSPFYHSRFALKFDGDKFDFDSVKDGEFEFKLYKIDPEDDGTREEIDAFALPKGELAKLCLSQGGCIGRTSKHAMNRGCTLNVRYGAYGGKIIPKIYDTVHGYVANKLRGPLCDTHISSSKGNVKDTEKILKKHMSGAQAAVDKLSVDHKALLQMYETVSKEERKLSNILEFEKSVFGRVQDRNESSDILQLIHECRTEHFFVAADADAPAPFLQKCQMRVAAYASDIKQTKISELKRELNEALNVKQQSGFFTKRLLSRDASIDVWDSSEKVTEKVTIASTLVEKALKLLQKWTGLKDDYQEVIIETVGEASFAVEMILPTFFQELEKLVFEEWSHISENADSKLQEKLEEHRKEMETGKSQLEQFQAEIKDSKTFFSNLQHQEESRLAEQERNIRIEQCTDILGKLQEELVKRADHKSALEGSKEKLRGLRTAVLVETRENRIFDHGMPGAEALLGNQSKLEAKLKEIKETIDKFDPEEDA